MILTIIVAVITGGIVGALAQLIIPGDQDLSLVKTIGLGIVGGIVAGVITGAFGGEGIAAGFSSFIFAVIVTAGLLFGAMKAGLVKTS